MKNEIDILRDVSEKLRSAGIEFMLTGSVAMSYYAQPRMTRDIDIVVSLGRASADTILHVFADDYYLSPEAVLDAIHRGLMFNAIHLESVIKVDLIVLANTSFARSEFGRRSTVSIGDFETTIISREDLILSKLLWAKDSGSEMQMKDVRNLLSGPCDQEYLRKWAEDLNITETMEDLLNSDE